MALGMDIHIKWEVPPVVATYVTTRVECGDTAALVREWKQGEYYATVVAGGIEITEIERGNYVQVLDRARAYVHEKESARLAFRSLRSALGEK